MPTPAADREELLRFVERFAILLEENGIPRMAGRVFAYVLADDADRYTAGELAEGLQVSPAAISGAVRWLVQTGMLGKEREPGARADTYRIYDDDVWGTITRQRISILDRWIVALDEGLQHLDTETRGGRRLQETRAYFDWLRDETEGLMERWAKRRQELFPDG